MNEVEHTIFETATGKIVSWGRGVPIVPEGYDWIEGEYHGDHFKVEGKNPVSTGGPVIPLHKIKAQTMSDIVSYLNWKANDVSGLVPESERSTWDAKEAAANAMKAGNASTKQTKMIEIESALANEAPNTTCDKIIKNATMFYICGPALGGIRRKCFKMVENATNQAEVELALAKAAQLWEAIIQDPTGFNADPAGFLQRLEG